MPLPIDLVLVRHGESESNAANRRSRKGDLSAYTPEYRARPKSQYRLTDWGRELAKNAGTWVKANIAPAFERYYASEYVRAFETAALMDFTNAQWHRHYALHERDWGELEGISDQERTQRFAASLKERLEDPLHWRPPGGESMVDVCLRVERFMDMLRRDAQGRSVIVVSHGETMWAFRIVIEGLTAAEYRDCENSPDPRHRIHNTQVIHYTRRGLPDPTLFDDYVWMRSSLPNDLPRSFDVWTTVVRPSRTSDELVHEAEQVPRLVM